MYPVYVLQQADRATAQGWKDRWRTRRNGTHSPAVSRTELKEAGRLGIPENDVELGVEYLRLDPSVPTTGPGGVELLLRVELRKQGHQLPLDKQGLKPLKDDVLPLTPSDFPEAP
jgi:hypothetical protein